MDGTNKDEAKANGNDRNSEYQDNSMLIRLMPVLVRQQLCDHLDYLDEWQLLAKYVELHGSDVEQIKKEKLSGRSPTNKFLDIWGGQYNHTVHSLFALLKKLGLHNGMRIIKDCVEEQYHKYIPRSIPTISELRATSASIASKLLNGPPNDSSSGVSDDNNESNSLESPENIRVSSVQRAAHSMLHIDYEELAAATQNWSPENNLGNGGFGDVFKGEWKQTEVAIKVMHNKQKKPDNTRVELQQSYNELKYLYSLRHDNILALYGYSVRGEKPCLVYQLMKNGSLDARLKASISKPPLTWEHRLNIALGTAKGINFLHTAQATKPLIHGDIKPANILLDQCLQPKIGDFGLAREGPRSVNAVTKVQKIFGTRIYLPPEFLSSRKLSTGVDVFSFGIVLLEMFSGLLMSECSQLSEQQNLLKYLQENCLDSNANNVELFDAQLAKPHGMELDKCVFAKNVGVRCAASIPQDRPSMHNVCEWFRSFEMKH
ncbi:hypothetical protein KR222_010325 [Zaprionus bogoriensis]|nr:hypothetical protein KR222_010325 [Zaprionus bogoriensis]